jgi:transposase
VDYLKNNLIPTLGKDDIVIMDNLRSHHVKEVKETFEKAGIHFLYLPPYSPDMNPIEMLWSKIKAILRSLEVRINEALPDAIASAFQRVSTADCIGWFNAVGLFG